MVKLGRARMSRIQTALYSLIILVMLTASITPIETTAQEQPGLEPFIIEPTRVYGAYEAFLEGNLMITEARYDPSRNLIIAGGSGFFALIKPDETPTLVWSETIIGEPTALELDNVYNPEWIVIGTSTGEVTALNLDDLGKRMNYYTSEGVTIKSAYIAGQDNDRYIMALNIDGYLYFYSISEPYWGVIGPDPGDGPISKLAGYSVAWTTPLFNKPSWNRGYWDPGRVLVSLREYPSDILSSVSAYLYYKDRDTGEERPILTGESQVENTTIRESRRLLYVLTVHPYGSTYGFGEFSGNATNNLFVIGGLPPVTFNLNIFYTITRVDTSLNVTVASECYYGSKLAHLKPGESTFIEKIVATYLAPTLDACLDEAGIQLEQQIDFNYFLTVDSTKLPYKLELGDNVKLVVVPIKAGAQATASESFLLVKPGSTPLGWPNGGYAILIIGVADEAYIYILDESMNLLNIPGVDTPYERVSLESRVTSIEVSPDAYRVYIGTMSGRLVMLEWLASEGRYVEKHSFQVSNSPVISIIELRNGEYVAAASQDGSLQLISLKDWKPQWRGVPGFPSINLGVGLSMMFHINGINLFAVTQQGSLLIFDHKLKSYIPLIGTVKALVKNLDGSISPLQASYYMEALEDSKVMAREKVVNDRAVLYVPEGSIVLDVYVEGLGKAVFQPITVSYPLASFNSTVTLREIQIYTYTPDKGRSEFEDPGYKLVAGPKSGVNITLNPTMQDPSLLEYTIVGEQVNTVTGPNGRAVLIVWDGLRYEGSARLREFEPARFTIDPLDPVSLEVEMHPILYSVTLEALDAEALRRNILYRAPQAEFTLNNIGYGSSVTITAGTGITTVGLPRGEYVITATSPYYYSASLEGVVVPETRNIRFSLSPRYYNVSMNVELVDELYGLASGPLPRASLMITLVKPALGYTIETTSHTPLVLRYGEYRVKVRDPLIGEKAYNIVVDSDGIYLLKAPPLYSNVSIELYDLEIENAYIPNAILEAEYHTDFWTNRVTITLEEIPYWLRLPYGSYTLTLSSFGYEKMVINTTISEPTALIKGRMEPSKVKVTIIAMFNDELTGLARGGVPAVQIEAKLVNPDIERPPIQLVTGSNGSITAVIRVGVYEITAESTYTEKTSISLEVLEPGVYTIELRPLYSNLTVEVVDDEVPVTIPGVTIQIKRLGPGLPAALSITSDDGIESLVLPVGSYAFSASLPSRYTSGQYTIDLSSRDRFTRITIEASPIRVSAEVLVQAINAYVKYKDEVELLPPGPIPNATVTLVPADPLLERVGVESVLASSDSNGVASFQEIRTGTYLILVQAEGYLASMASASILTDGQRVSIGLTPLIHKVSFIVVDPELIPQLAVLEKVNITIAAYNNVSSSTNLIYTVGDTIEMATGIYTLILNSNGYVDTPATIIVKRDSSYNLTITPLKYNVTIVLKGVTEFGESPITSGLIRAEAVDLDLVNPIVTAPVIDGIASLNLRPGMYNLLYSEPTINYQVRLEAVNVTGSIEFTASLEAPTYTVEFIILDSEFETPINASSISIDYLGPFGEGSKTIEAKGTVIVTSLPAGTIRVAVTAPGYLELRRQLSLSSDFSFELRLTPFKVDVVFTLVNPDEEQVTDINVRAVLQHKTLPYVIEGVSNKGILILREARIGSYTLLLIPPQESPYTNTTLNVRIHPDGSVEPDTLVIDYKVYNVTIQLLDRDDGKPIEIPYKVTIVRSGKGSEKLGFPLTLEITGKMNATLPVGSYRIELAPVDREYYMAPTTTITFKVPDSMEVSIVLTARQFPVSILVVDDRGDPIPAAFVRVIGEGGVVVDAGYTDVTGVFSTQLKFGVYSVEVEKPGYATSTVPFQVPQSTTVTAELNPGPMILVRRFLPLLIGVGGLITLAGTLYIMRERISKRILEEEEYF